MLESIDAGTDRMRRTSLHARLLGPMMVTLRGERIDIASSRRTRNVLAYLLLHRRSPVPRDVLMDTFWPDASQAAATNSLHVALSGVRRALAAAWSGPVIVRQPGGYRLAKDLAVWVDVEEFERLCRDGRRADRAGDAGTALACYSAADQLYGGELLADDPYADWPEYARETLRLDLLCVLRRLAELYSGGRDHTAAALIARRALEIDPCDEPMHRQLMRSYQESDQVHLALAQFHSCADRLWSSHRIGPSSATTELYEQLRRGQVMGARNSA